MFLKKSLGQNFLNDKNILAKEASLLNPKNKIVLEIGAGDGRLTEQIFLLNPKKLFAVEKDARMTEFLKKKFTKIQILHCDFLKIKPFKIDKIIGNIPYYISSSIIFKLKEFEFEDALLMVQDEFAKKMVANANESNYGRLSVTSQLFYEVKYIQKIPASLFIPKPKVNSAIIMLKKKNLNITPQIEDIIRALFQHKNKTIRNALLDAGFEKKDLEKLGTLQNLRPRTLSPNKILEICQLIL